MSDHKKINELLKIDDSYKAPEKIMSILKNNGEAYELFLNFLEVYKWDLSYDWFRDYFQDEHSDRKVKKQDFTPDCVSNLIARLTQSDVCIGGVVLDAACGTGSIVIKHWYEHTRKSIPWEYNPLSVIYRCEELSDRAVPFLLFNLLIRGINAVVVHGDVLSREAKAAYCCYNQNNEPTGFSALYELPKDKITESMLNIKFSGRAI